MAVTPEQAQQFLDGNPALKAAFMRVMHLMAARQVLADCLPGNAAAEVTSAHLRVIAYDLLTGAGVLPAAADQLLAAAETNVREDPV